MLSGSSETDLQALFIICSEQTKHCVFPNLTYRRVQIRILSSVDATSYWAATALPFAPVPVIKKLIIPLPGTLALAFPSPPTAMVVSLMSCVLSVYQAFTLGFTSVLPVRLMLTD